MRAGTTARLRACLTVVALAACSASDLGRDSAAAPPRAADVQSAFRAHVGRTWELERLGEQEIPVPAVRTQPGSGGRHPGPGSRPTIRFTAELAPGGSVHPAGLPTAGGWSFCNGYGTAYALGPGDALRFHGFQSTLVGCDGPDSLETRFFRGLHETRRVELDGASLSLVAEDGSRLTFVLATDSVGS